MGGGGTDQQSTQRGSTVNFHSCVERQSSLLILEEGGSPFHAKVKVELSLSHGKAIASVDPGGGYAIDADPPQFTISNFVNPPQIRILLIQGGDVRQSTISTGDQQSTLYFGAENRSLHVPL